VLIAARVRRFRGIPARTWAAAGAPRAERIAPHFIRRKPLTPSCRARCARRVATNVGSLYRSAPRNRRTEVHKPMLPCVENSSRADHG